ncbi:hypothetical protein S83_039628, partial [Arachis hypogaea]
LHNLHVLFTYDSKSDIFQASIIVAVIISISFYKLLIMFLFYKAIKLCIKTVHSNLDHILPNSHQFSCIF